MTHWLKYCFILMLPVYSDVFSANDGSYEAMVVHYRQSSHPLTFNGVSAYKSTSVLSFKVGGIIAARIPIAGSVILKAEPLATLIQDEIDSQIRDTESQVELIRNRVKRYRSLHDNRFLPLQTVEQIEIEYLNASNRLEMLAFQKTHSLLSSPEDCMVLQVLADRYETVQPGQPVIKIARLNAGWVVKIDMTESMVAKISKLGKARIYFNNTPGAVVKGHVSKIGQTASQNTGTFPVEITLDEPIERLYEGYSANVMIDRLTLVALMPVQSIVGMLDPETAEVFVYDPQTHKVVKQKVTIDYIKGNQVAIKSGVKNGQMIITKGASFIPGNHRVEAVTVLDKSATEP